MKIYFTERFIKKIEKMQKNNPSLNLKVQKTLRVFKNNPSHPSLRLHKISTSSNYSISVNMEIRIILNWKRDMVYILNIGTHDEVY